MRNISGIPSWLASLLGILLESIVYGFFVFLYLVNFVTANCEKTVPVYRQRIIQVSTLMLILATAHLALAFIRLVHGFTPNNEVVDIAVFGRLQDPLYRGKIAIYFIQTMMADGLMTWRCFVIYERLWWVLVPGVLAILLDFATMVVRLLPPPQPLPENDPLGINGLIPLGCRIAFLTTTMSLHLIGSTAIVVKIYLTRRSIQSAGRSLSPVIIAIVESAALYTVAVFLLLLCNLINTFGQFVVMDIIIPLVGVVFCLIALRIRLFLRKTSQSSGEIPTRGVSTYPSSAFPRIEAPMDHEPSIRTSNRSITDGTSSKAQDPEKYSGREIAAV